MDIEETIDKLYSKYAEWLNSEPDNKVTLRNWIEQHPNFIAGGAIASLLNDLEPNDYDVYFVNKLKAKLLADYYINTHPALIEVKSTKAVLLKNRIQIIYLLGDEPQKLINTFDFLHCQTFWDFKNENEIHFNEGTLDAIKNKKLIYKGSKYPIIALKRVEKFLARGYTIEKEEMEKILKEVTDFYINRKNEKDELIPPMRKELDWAEVVVNEVRLGKFERLHTVQGLY